MGDPICGPGPSVPLKGCRRSPTGRGGSRQGSWRHPLCGRLRVYEACRQTDKTLVYVWISCVRWGVLSGMSACSSSSSNSSIDSISCFDDCSWSVVLETACS